MEEIGSAGEDTCVGVGMGQRGLGERVVGAGGGEARR